MVEAYKEKPITEFQALKEAGQMNEDAFSRFILDNTIKIVNRDIGKDSDFTIIYVDSGRLILHESFLQIGEQFCQTYAKEIGLPESENTETGRRNFIIEFEKRYFETLKRENVWSREVLLDAILNLWDRGDLRLTRNCYWCS